MRSLLWILLAVGAATNIALGWGLEAHEAIGALAEQMIPTRIREQVQTLLREANSRDLGSISNWADEVTAASRGLGPLAHDPEAQAFNRQFPKNPTWHFVNLPLGTRAYEDAKAFTSPDDVVHAIRRCIVVLESPEPVPGEFNRVEALRLLVHFVGDIQQPLHCGSGYYRLEDPHRPQLVKEPARALGLPSDRGGNGLFYAPEQRLHLLWDVGLVERITGSKDYHLLATALAKASQDVPVTSGDYHDWAKLWAVESVRVADVAYEEVQFGDAVLSEDRASVQISVSLPPNYVDASVVLVTRQLAKGAARFSQLLEKIAWPQPKG
jgi:hypothetical protein